MYVIHAPVLAHLLSSVFISSEFFMNYFMTLFVYIRNLPFHPSVYSCVNVHVVLCAYMYDIYAPVFFLCAIRTVMNKL